MKGWDEKHLERLLKENKIRGYEVKSRSPRKKKAGKYKNQKLEVDGMTFDSTKEGYRYIELRRQQMADEITELQCQVPYLLIEANETERKCEYKADFRYRIVATGKLVVEDVKSKATRKLSTYIMKRKLMKGKYGIKILET